MAPIRSKLEDLTRSRFCSLPLLSPFDEILAGSSVNGKGARASERKRSGYANLRGALQIHR